MRAGDIAGCAEIIATHPVIAPRYGSGIKDLAPAWLRLLGSEGMQAVVYEEVDGTHVTAWGLGVGVFVKDDFIREIKAPPLIWYGPELARRVMRGDSPLLSDKEVRDANSREGLNLLVWESGPCMEYAKRADVYHLMGKTYIECFGGYLLKEMITSQMESAERLRWSIDAGGMLWNATEGRYVTKWGSDAAQICKEPHIVGLTRELEAARPGSWVGVLFNYHPPLLFFSRGEQRLLLSALPGRTDKELSDELGISPLTVKHLWRSIYNRASSRLPELTQDSPTSSAGVAPRGKEKKRHLLAYLREHPEELRPVSRKLIQQGATKRGPGTSQL
jgi:hypothetical protein